VAVNSLHCNCAKHNISSKNTSKAKLSSVMYDKTVWHHKYDHVNLDSLKVLKQRNMIIGLPRTNIDKNIYEGCIIKKCTNFH